MTAADELTDAQLEARIHAALEAGASVVALDKPEWRSGSYPVLSTHGSSQATRRRARRPARTAALATVTVLVAVVAGLSVVPRSPHGRHVAVVPPAPDTASAPNDFAVLPSGSGPPQVPWRPGSGAPTVLGNLPDVASHPVSSATFAVQVGLGSRWSWVVAGVGSTALKVALDSSMQGPGALSPDGKQLAVAFPGLVELVDLTGRQPIRSITTGPAASGSPIWVSWSPDSQSVAILRRGPQSTANNTAASVVEVASLSGTKVQRFSVGGGPRGLAWSPDATQLVTTGSSQAVVGPTGATRFGLAVTINLVTGQGRMLPTQALGDIVGWFGPQLVRSFAGGQAIGPPTTGPVATTTAPATNPSGAVAFEDLNGRDIRSFPTVGGFLDQFGYPFDPSGNYGLIRAARSGGTDPYAWVADLRTGAAVSRLVDQTQVPYVLGLGNGTIIVADTVGGTFEVSAINWSTKVRTLLGALRFTDEGFTFLTGIQAVVPQ